MYLPTDTLLHNRYSIEHEIGQGGFGVTYLARDLTLHVKVAVKEYLPRQLASRAEGKAKVTIYSGEAREHFEYGLKKFLEEARSVARFANHPNIVSARDYFEENGTAYMVMEYIEGVTFKQFLEQKGGTIPFELASQIMMPVMDALREVHVTGLLHRDISPDNVYITADGRIKLLDFGAARYFAGEQSKSLSVILKTGYAPEEQYRSSGKQGAWTDVYAAAATIYRAITGRTPPDALDRKEEDTLEPPSRLGVAITSEAEQALMKALAVNAQSRFQDMGEFQSALRSEAIIRLSPIAQVSDGLTQPYHAPLQRSAVSQPGPIPSQPRPFRRKKASSAAPPIIISVAVLVLMGSGVLWYASRIGSKDGSSRGQTGLTATMVVPKAIPVPTVPQGQGAPPSIPKSVLAKQMFEQANDLLNEGKDEQAIGPLRKVVMLEPNNIKALCALGTTYMKMGHYVDALEPLKRVTTLEKDHTLAYNALATSLSRLNRHLEAIPIWEQVLKQQYNFPSAQFELGMSYLGVGNLEKAMGQCNILQRMDKGKADILLTKINGMYPTPPNSQEKNVEARATAVSTSVQPPAVTTGPRWSWTASRLVNPDELASISAEDLILMRNEIYARHGWIFRRQDLQDYFQRQPWYRPRGGLNRQMEINKTIALNLNSYEKKNADLIFWEQKKRKRP